MRRVNAHAPRKATSGRASPWRSNWTRPRPLVQGALGWLLGRSDRTVPIPGIRTAAQAEENAGALRHGPLTAAEMAQIGELLASASGPVAPRS
ncbi:aldo/keto reductase [Nonomuraea polychroma]|uniref:aldo/keto reductase n=1 Tax=Nonomuraea polychroma TaxID=46176 RepID=UPI003D8CFA70